MRLCQLPIQIQIHYDFMTFHFVCLSPFPILCHFRVYPLLLIILPCLSFPTICHSIYLSLPIVYHSPLFVIYHCLSFTIGCDTPIVYNSLISVISLCLLFPIICHLATPLISFMGVCHCPLSVIPDFVSSPLSIIFNFSVICLSPIQDCPSPSFIIVCYSPLSVIHQCMS